MTNNVLTKLSIRKNPDLETNYSAVSSIMRILHVASEEQMRN